MKKAMQEVKTAANQLEDITKALVDRHCSSLDKLVAKAKGTNLEETSTLTLSQLMLDIQVECYYFATHKYAADLRQACAEAVYKEKQSFYFLGSAGSVESRRSEANQQSAEYQMTNILFDNVSSAFKLKLDEAHRLVQVLNSAMISKNANNKLFSEK